MKSISYFISKIKSHSGKKLYINIVGMVLISLFEGIGIFMIIPMIGITGIIDVNTTKIPFIYWMSNILQELPKTVSLSLMLGLYVIIITAQSFFQQRQIILSAKIQQGFVRHLRDETYRLLLQANWGFFINKKKSDIINFMTTEVAKVSTGAHMFLQFLASLVFTLIQIVLAFWLSAKMTLFVLIFGIGLIYCSRTFIKKNNSLGNSSIELSKTYFSGITDHFNGIKDIKSNTLEEFHLSWFRSLNHKMVNNVIDYVHLKAMSELIYRVASAILIAVFIFFSIKMFQKQPAQLILVVIIFSRLWPRFTGIQSNLEQLASILPSFKALADLQNQCIEAKEFEELELKNVAPMIINKGIECRNVYFRYNISQPIFALQNINFKIPINKMTAIVGRSGAGKSTLIDLLMGLNRPETGKVLVDDNILTNENLIALRKSISYVPQDPFLFNATIRENLLIIDQNAVDEQIWEALQFSAAAEFVKRLPNGLDTLIGDRGIKLSGGERQRLVLARAILRRPSILVLDEATSALDTENETKIQESLEKLKGKMTIIVIAHRLSTIRNADQVIALDQGEIIQQGKFSQLAKEKKGLFNQLLQNQMEVSV